MISLEDGVLKDFCFSDWISGRLSILTCSMARHIELKRAKEIEELLKLGYLMPASFASTPDVLFWKALINGDLTTRARIKALEIGKFQSPRKALRHAVMHSQIGQRFSEYGNYDLALGSYPFAEIVVQDNRCLKMPIIVNQKNRRIAINPYYIAARHRLDGLETIPSSLDVEEILGFSLDIRRALSLIDNFVPCIGSEISCLIKYIIPLKGSADRAYSGSNSSLPSMSFISSRVKDIRILAEMIIHEFHHSKLFLLQHWDSLFLYSDDTSWGGMKLYSPWRECMRPLQGLLHGAFVFSGVSVYWKQISQRSGDKASRRAATAAAESFVVSQSLLKFSALSCWGKRLVLALIELNLSVLNSICNWEELRAWSPDKKIEDHDRRTILQLLNHYSRLCL